MCALCIYARTILSNLLLCLTTSRPVWVILALVKSNIFSGLVCFLHSLTLRLFVEMTFYFQFYSFNNWLYASVFETAYLTAKYLFALFLWKKAFTMQLKQCMCVWSVYTSIPTSVNYQLFGKQNCVLQGTFLIIRSKYHFCFVYGPTMYACFKWHYWWRTYIITIIIIIIVQYR